jgi:hypothetical protein
MALISENVNELIEEITKGYYGKKAISAAKSSIKEIIRHPFKSSKSIAPTKNNLNRYQKTYRNVKAALQYKFDPVKKLASDTVSKLATNVKDAGGKTFADAGDDISNITGVGIIGLGKRMSGSKSSAEPLTKRTALAGARLGLTAFGGIPGKAIAGGGTAAYNLAKITKDRGTLSGLGNKLKDLRDKDNALHAHDPALTKPNLPIEDKKDEFIKRIADATKAIHTAKKPLDSKTKLNSDDFNK